MPWQTLDSKNIVAPADELNTDVFTPKIFMQVLGIANPDGASAVNARHRVGNTTVDTGSNYNNRTSFDGGTDSVSGAIGYIETNVTGLDNSNELGLQLSYLVNISGEEKLIINFSVANFALGAGSPPRRLETVCKWVNTSQIDIAQLYNSGGAGDLGSNSSISVLGTD